MSQVLQISIETGNAAFDDGNRDAELARILRAAADKVENGQTDFNLRDFNGNTVGSVTLGEELSL